MRQFVLALTLLKFAAVAAPAQDPVQVSPNEYKVEMENDQVRVLRLKRPAHAKMPMHEHSRDFIAINLTDTHQRITGADGKSVETVRKKGNIAFGRPVKHEEENLSDQPMEVVIVELKTKSPPAAVVSPVALDPVKVDPTSHKVAFENDEVRVLDTTRPPHVKGAMHGHPNMVVVYTTDLHSILRNADGTTIDDWRKAGDIGWRDALTHSPENLFDTPIKEIQIELKYLPEKGH